MRIRRHAKISQLLDTAPFLKPGTVLQTYVCQLNQSPWDVMNFSPPSSPPPPPQQPPPPPLQPSQVNGAGVSGGNGGSDRRVAVVEREIKNNGHMNESVGDAATAAAAATKKKVKKEQCCKTDGKSWRCRREAAEGSSLCDHHLSLVKNYQNLAHNAAKRPAKSAADTRHSARSNSMKASSPSDSHEFYYYSGFRPGWSKKRGQTSKDADPGEPRKSDYKREAGPQMDNGDHELDWQEEEDEEGEYEGEEDRGNGKKMRVRKPIKARSLKSLM